jgi:hypothetical protein
MLMAASSSNPTFHNRDTEGVRVRSVYVCVRVRFVCVCVRACALCVCVRAVCVPDKIWFECMYRDSCRVREQLHGRAECGA